MLHFESNVLLRILAVRGGIFKCALYRREVAIKIYTKKCRIIGVADMPIHCRHIDFADASPKNR